MGAPPMPTILCADSSYIEKNEREGEEQQGKRKEAAFKRWHKRERGREREREERVGDLCLCFVCVHREIR
jgi:hypothetical protein